MTAALDHLVWAVPDLERDVASLAARTGVQPVPGGRHEGFGTANLLVALSGDLGRGGYLEIIGPDPAQPGFTGHRPFLVDPDRPARLATWAVRVTDLDAVVDGARSAGYEPGDIRSMSRATPTGERLEWRLTPPDASFDGVVPFLIDWGSTPHPSSRAMPEIELRAFHATHPRPDEVQAALAAIGAHLPVGLGPPSLVAELGTPNGAVFLA